MPIFGGGGLGLLSVSVPGVGGGESSGLYNLMEHQFLRFKRRLLFLGFPFIS